MGEYKKLVERHDADMDRLNDLMVQVHQVVADGNVTVAEVIGTLEVTKMLLFEESDADPCAGCDEPEIRFVHVNGGEDLEKVIKSFFDGDEKEG